jgi:hypothetical protein
MYLVTPTCLITSMLSKINNEVALRNPDSFSKDQVHINLLMIGV